MKFKNLFLTGNIQVGKSTALDKLKAQHLTGQKIRGFKTKPFYLSEKTQQDPRGILQGYWLEEQSLDPASQCPEKQLVGINQASPGGKCCRGITETFEGLGLEVLTKALQEQEGILWMDELGFFEREALQFQAKVFEALESPMPVIGVIKIRRNPFLEAIAARKDVLVLEVNEDNRDSIVEEIIKYWEWLR